MDTTENDSELVTTKDVVKALFNEFGGPKAVAKYLDVSLARVYTFRDEAFPKNNLSFKVVAHLTSSKATAAACYLAQQAGGVFFPLALQTGESPMALIGKSARSNGEALAESLRSLADGVVDASEKRSIVKEIDAAIRDLASLRSALVALADGEG